MVSRRKILNRSRDNLSADHEEEDIWYQKDKLFKVSRSGNCSTAFANYFAINVGRADFTLSFFFFVCENLCLW